MNDQQVEAEIQAKGLTAPRVTPAHIESVIAEEYFNTAAGLLKGTPGESSKSLGLLTVCFLVLKNGFTIIGKSACASPENFNEELGRKIARTDAINQIWALEGYLLREKLYEQSNQHEEAHTGGL